MRFLLFDDMTQCTEAAVDAMLPLVSDQRRQEALAFKHVFGQFACLKSYLMLQELLRLDGHDLNSLVFERSEHGKPVLEALPDVHFNISHCKTGILVAVADCPIGVDIESYRRFNESLVQHTMNDAEQAQIQAAANPTEAFTALWTQKEAFVKWRGTGLTEDIPSLLTRPELMPTHSETHIAPNYAYTLMY